MPLFDLALKGVGIGLQKGAKLGWSVAKTGGRLGWETAKLGKNLTPLAVNLATWAIKHPKTVAGVGLGSYAMFGSMDQSPYASPSITGTTIAPINYNREAIMAEEMGQKIPQTGFAYSQQQVPYAIQPSLDQRTYGLFKDSTSNLAQSLWASRHG